MKNMQSKKVLKAAVLALLLLAILPSKTWALYVTDPLCGGDTGSPVCLGTIVSCSNGEAPSCSSNGNPACSGTPSVPTCPGGGTPQCPNSKGLIDPGKVIFSGHSGAAQSILTVSLLIMLVMSFAIGIVYGIGYAFRIDKLLRFAKSEIGEIILTLLIVLLFVGTFTVTSANIGANNFFAAGSGALNNDVFVSDCSMLAQQSFNLIPTLFVFGSLGSVLTTIGSFQIDLAPNYMGVSFKPLYGISALVPVANGLIYGTSGFVIILMGVAAFIVIIYSLFPLFLYLGIILRTLPWTRPAGGAFLGLFLAFYIMFPLLIYYLLVGYVPYLGTPGLSMQTNPVNQGSSDTITATCLTSKDGCQLLVENAVFSKKIPGTGTVSYDSYELGSGCYDVVATDTETSRSTMQILTVNPVPSPCQNDGSYGNLAGVLSSQTGSFEPNSFLSVFLTLASTFMPFSSTASTGLLNGFIVSYIEPLIYILFSVVLSLIISFDFMEAMGDLLGAPSLRSQNMLKRVL